MNMTNTMNKSIRCLEQGHVTTPSGFTAGGVHTGLRKKKLDFGWLHSDIPAVAAGVYTTNTFQAAPLKVTQEAIEVDQKIQTIVCNSAIANACTGHIGYKNAKIMQEETAEKMNVAAHHVAVYSTGLIGEQLPMDKIKTGIEQMSEQSAYQVDAFEHAILTTDTVTKHAAVQCEIDGKTVTLGGAAKGSGMIEPNMATMLGFVTTDAVIEHEPLLKALRSVTDQTFNMITVDGDSSTNDSVLVLANQRAGNETLTEDHPDYPVFIQALTLLSEKLAQKIAEDGEGATKLIEVNVTNAHSVTAARKIAKSVISSNLVKTAVYGADPNWGRVVCAVGYSNEPVNPDLVDVFLGPVQVVSGGLPLAFDEEKATDYLINKTIEITVDLHDGDESAKAWGCDLTYQYVTINASYRT
ncbi:glutamate N-acetyltransferase [Salisediminibacterium halotolerans]|nr:glutamate N-acetyltransferase [Actinophytocola xinjiangensis]RPE87883.1 glutamate N-acetyltransferase [Salisediminibacterium halotolerans]TWG37920.1 glutamate N-acetyltransferase [Salisediminibacterium halotolerans]GEL08255.1 arginine biosynthesis bifunctional protein ArgJ [Salisediminibacterium halotolerans]